MVGDWILNIIMHRGGRESDRLIRLRSCCRCPIFRPDNWFSTDLYEREGNKILSRGILGRDVLSRSMFEAEPFFFGCQVNGKVFLQKMRKEV